MVLKAVTTLIVLLAFQGNVIAETSALNDARQIALTEDHIARPTAGAGFNATNHHCDWLIPRTFGWCERLPDKIKNG